MTSFIKRHQVLLLSAFLCLFSLHMALTEKRQIGGDVIVARTIRAALSPFQAALTGTYNYFSDSWNSYIYLVGLSEENEAQNKTILVLTEENNRLREALSENKRLSELLAFKEEGRAETVGARILAFNLGAWTKTIKLNKGSDNGIAPDSPVISHDGVVGMTIEVSGSSSTALLVTDPRFNIDILVQRSRVRGVAEGNGADGLSLKYIRELDDVVEGDTILTAGQSGIYPKGLVIGTVLRVEKAGDNFFKRIDIRPGADLQKLEEVLVTTKRPE